MKEIALVVIVFFFYSCKSTNEKNSNLSENLNHSVEMDSSLSYFENKDKYRKMAFQAISNNDQRSYDVAADFLLFHPDNIEQLFFSTNMAYKNNYPKAYHDTFVLMSILHEPDDTNSILNYFRLYNLAKSYELGYKGAVYGIKLLKDKNGNIRTSDYFLDKMKTVSSTSSH